MAFNELIKSFDNIRQLMRDFYVFGFKSRADFADKSARSYDNERRRIESWLGEYMYFRQNAGGKNCFISVDSRKIRHNPFYKALKAKSFTANDIMLHFFLLDILQPGEKMTLRQLMDRMDAAYLSCFDEPVALDISTVRKKLAEYAELGLIENEKCGRELYYERSQDEVDLDAWYDAVSFFAETNQIGVVGSFIEDKFAAGSSVFSYKHHYLLHALESDVLLDLLAAMERRQCVRIESCSSKGKNISFRVLPLKIYVSTQSGRRYVMCWFFKAHRIIFCRLDNLERVLEAKPVHDYDKFCAMAEQMEQHLWGVSECLLPMLWSTWSLLCASAVTSRIFCNVWSGKSAADEWKKQMPSIIVLLPMCMMQVKCCLGCVPLSAVLKAFRAAIRLWQKSFGRIWLRCTQCMVWRKQVKRR